MDTAATTIRFMAAGRFRDALGYLESEPNIKLPNRVERRRLDLLYAEILEKTGRPDQAFSTVQSMMKAKDLTEYERARCEFILSRVHAERGDFDSEVTHLQRSISHAQRAGDLEQTCWSQLRLVAAFADTVGPESVAPLLAALRANVVKLGEPRVTAAMHLFIAEIDGKRGLLDKALAHTTIARNLLAKSPNVWLEAWTHNIMLAVSVLKGDFEGALAHSHLALAASAECGVTAMLRGCVGNLGNLYLARGEFDEALRYLSQVDSFPRSGSEQLNATTESKARIYLAQGRFAECRDLLNDIETSVSSSSGRGRYVHRHSLLTKANLLLAENLWNEALILVEAVVSLASAAGDEVLGGSGKLLKARLLCRLGDGIRAQTVLTDVVPTLTKYPLQLGARYEAALAHALLCEGRVELAEIHLSRSLGICDRLRDRITALELTSSESAPLNRRAEPSPAGSTNSGQAVLQDAAALMMHAGRPELLAGEIVAMLAHTGSVEGAVAVARDGANAVETLASHGSLDSDGPTRTFRLGTARQRSIEVLVRPSSGLESMATLNAVSILLGAIQDLEQAHAEREERLTLWPSDELPAENDNAVIMGQMRSVMELARKVARTNVSVLITGESGTGKEVIARAIHQYSNRAHKPFVPFNCTAVPRELLESQLFGYRRGAFTGADRDNQGLIRTAQDGTLFFDEIGELGLDLQPKLLRFLESGEINPLGELAPVNVDVRIIAATNANLEQLVQDGRFREDLYYRLNVIRLTVAPLRERRDEIPSLVHHFVARAASEYAKGRVRVAEETMEHLILYPWPGNVRQLQNELRRMVALADTDSILMPTALSESILRATPRSTRSGNGLEIVVPLTDKLIPTLTKIEGEMIRVALRSCQGRVEAAARALGISRKGLYLKRQRLGL